MLKRTLFLTATGEQGNGKPDQKDIVAQNETLTQQLTDANTAKATLTGQLSEANTAKTKLEGEKATLAQQLSDANAAKTKLESEKATLTQQLADANAAKAKLESEKNALTTALGEANTKLQAAEKRAEPIQKQLAAKLAEHGIRATAVEVPREQDGKKLTATERVKLAKGQV